MSRSLGAALPFWLDRPELEALDIARTAEEAGVDTVWVGEMASFDAFALATAIGLQTRRAHLKVGPLAVGVRSPVAIALGVASVATLTGKPVDVALGASSPAIVSGWHDRPWSALAEQTFSSALSLRGLLQGERVRGFKLRAPQPESSITIAAFGPAMTRVAARHADELVLNLVTPEHVARVAERVNEEADAVGRTAPRIAVWVPVALDPGERALAQLAGQLAVYLAAPGYGEMFTELGFGELVKRSRAGTPRAELAAAIPVELAARIGAIGGADEVVARVAAFHDAGADHVAVVPSTAEDPAGARVLHALCAQTVGRR